MDPLTDSHESLLEDERGCRVRSRREQPGEVIGNERVRHWHQRRRTEQGDVQAGAPTRFRIGIQELPVGRHGVAEVVLDLREGAIAFKRLERRALPAYGLAHLRAVIVLVSANSELSSEGP